MKNILPLIIAVSFLSYRGFAQTDGIALAQKVADAYGLSNFKKVKSMSYTFNIKRDTFPVSYRSWNWDVQTNIVTMTTPNHTITYRRDTIQSATMKSVDGRFINDQYWFIFPFHTVMDKGCTLTQKENVTSPIGKANATMLTIQYNNVDGYTPGDAYDLYIDKNYMVTEWVYKSKGIEKPSLNTRWENTVKNKGIKTATNFTSEDGKFRIYFTDISVK
ncbi:MAG: hypothetical protein ACKVOM_13120 [Ferruginibacter sp.]